MSDAEGVRLQKVLAAAGIGSRRACEALIDQGRVSVDGQQVHGQGMRIDPAVAVVRVDGEVVDVSPDHAVVAVNKPVGMLSTMSDDRDRPCVGDLVADRAVRLFHVGRLDADTEGLLLMTNDGALAQHLTHPSFGVDKTYVAEVGSGFGPPQLRQIRTGVRVEDRQVEVSSAKIVSSTKDRTMVELTIHEGRNRIVRRLFDEIGFDVKRLVRTKFGPIVLGNQRPGTTRDLTRQELSKLYGLMHSSR